MNETRWGSVLVADAPASTLGAWVAGDALRRSQAQLGGVWVGARIRVVESRIVWAPFGWDRLMHRSLRGGSVAFSQVTRLERTQQGWVGTLFVGFSGGELVFRCYRAASLAERLARAVRAYAAQRVLPVEVDAV